MSTTDHLLGALKQILKRQGITYKAAADALGLSEASVKRLFSERSFSLDRLDKLCELAGTDIGELLQVAEAGMQQTDQLSVQQERELVSDLKLLLVAVCIINLWSFDEILNRYSFQKPELVRLFAALDRHGIIELLPGNRYKLKLSRRFRWQPGGPIQAFFLGSILKESLETGLRDNQTHLRFVWGMLTRESAQECNRKIARLIEEYLLLAKQDVRVSVEEKLSSSLFILFRENWEPAVFKSQSRKPC